MDDAVNRVRRVPAQQIKYPQREAQNGSDREVTYGTTYDPQARSGVRFRFSDIDNAEPERLDLRDAAQPLNQFSQRRTQRVVAASGTTLRRVPRRQSSEPTQNPLR